MAYGLVFIGDYEKAIYYLKKALKSSYEHIYKGDAPVHPGAASHFNNLAVAYRRNGKDHYVFCIHCQTSNFARRRKKYLSVTHNERVSLFAPCDVTFKINGLGENS